MTLLTSIFWSVHVFFERNYESLPVCTKNYQSLPARWLNCMDDSINVEDITRVYSKQTQTWEHVKTLTRYKRGTKLICEYCCDHQQNDLKITPVQLARSLKCSKKWKNI